MMKIEQIDKEDLIMFILETRALLKEVLMVGNRSVKNNSKNSAYEILTKLQNKYKSNSVISDICFLMKVFVEDKMYPYSNSIHIDLLDDLDDLLKENE